MDYDLIIIGCGPAGMSAGIYSARLGLKTVIFEAKVHGGAMALAHIVENYPGFVSTSGQELADRMLVSPWAMMWAPDLLIGALGIYLLLRMGAK